MTQAKVQSSVVENDFSVEPADWFCLRTLVKREHIAAAILDSIVGVEVFCPRISQIRKIRSGKKRFVEAMFPGYIFARFCFNAHYRQVIHSQGVTRMVQLGERRVVPERIIEELKSSLPDSVVEMPDPSLNPGAQIEFISGSLKGLNGKVLAQLPAKNRVEILLYILGQEIKVAVNPSDILLAGEANL